MSDNIVNSYPFHNEHETVWSSHQDTTTPIAKSWARLYDRGVVVGPPIGDEYVVNGKTCQNFQYAYAQEDTDGQTVIFSDARGVVGTESGL